MFVLFLVEWIGLSVPYCLVSYVLVAIVPYCFGFVLFLVECIGLRAGDYWFVDEMVLYDPSKAKQLGNDVTRWTLKASEVASLPDDDYDEADQTAVKSDAASPAAKSVAASPAVKSDAASPAAKSVAASPAPSSSGKSEPAQPEPMRSLKQHDSAEHGLLTSALFYCTSLLLFL